MIYLHDNHIRDIGIDWHKLTGIIEDCIKIKALGDCSHPLKPYLRYRDPINRIIAMPAFVGGSINLSGIKWIASFPNNGRLGLPRAHNTVILNQADTGQPVAFFNSGLISALRTAAVSGLMLKAFLEARHLETVRVGIVGWGPIGRTHLDMFIELLGNKLGQITIYDLKEIDPDTIPEHVRAMTHIANDWQTVYHNVDVFTTCTVSSKRYIDEEPQKGILLLNVSLRDFKPESVAKVNAIVVDDWLEVCRENTDIEQLHLHCGLRQADVLTIEDVICRNGMTAYPNDEPVFFSPMGLAVFDIAVAGYYLQEALRLGKGVQLEEA